MDRAFLRNQAERRRKGMADANTATITSIASGNCSANWAIRRLRLRRKKQTTTSPTQQQCEGNRRNSHAIKALQTAKLRHLSKRTAAATPCLDPQCRFCVQKKIIEPPVSIGWLNRRARVLAPAHPGLAVGYHSSFVRASLRLMDFVFCRVRKNNPVTPTCTPRARPQISGRKYSKSGNPRANYLKTGAKVEVS